MGRNLKSGAEVIGEMILAGLRSKPKDEREKLMEDHKFRAPSEQEIKDVLSKFI